MLKISTPSKPVHTSSYLINFISHTVTKNTSIWEYIITFNCVVTDAHYQSHDMSGISASAVTNTYRILENVVFKSISI